MPLSTTSLRSASNPQQSFCTVRSLSTKNPLQSTKSIEGHHIENNEIVLYQRNHQNRSDQSRFLFVMRSGVVFSSFHTVYWIWYLEYFVPLMNASQYEILHIHEGWAYLGVSVAVVLQGVVFAVSKRVVSKLTWNPTENKIHIYTFNLPFVIPSKNPSVSFPAGTAIKSKNQSQTVVSNKSPIGLFEDENITPSTTEKQNSSDKAQSPSLLDPASEIAVHILRKLDGDLSKFSGNLRIGYRWPPYVLDIQQALNNVKEPQLLFQALFATHYMRTELLEERDNQINTSRKVKAKTKQSRQSRLISVEKPSGTQKKTRRS